MTYLKNNLTRSIMLINNKTELEKRCFYGLETAKFAVEGPNFPIFQVMPLFVSKDVKFFLASITDIAVIKEIHITLRLFLVIAMYCQAGSSQINESLKLAHC